MRKTILFLTGTRADFGKLKSLIQVINDHPEEFDYHIFATGMHLQKMYGETVIEIEKCGFKNIHKFNNATSETTMDLTLAKTIQGFSIVVKKIKPDLIVVHGDRVESLAGAIVGSLNNILVGHVEGGEISGTVDEIVRHAVSKMSHIHFVSHAVASKRLSQLGELEKTIFNIGSPDLDVLFSNDLPSLEFVKEHYDIKFRDYAILLYHPVTTANDMELQANQLVDTLIEDSRNYIVIYPNNDLGSSSIFKAYERIKSNHRFRIFPSLRFEYFIRLLKDAQFLIGNSSAGIHEAPYLGIPAVNIGNRQHNRDLDTASIIHVEVTAEAIKEGIDKASKMTTTAKRIHNKSSSASQFLKVLQSDAIWNTNHQKQFNDILG